MAIPARIAFALLLFTAPVAAQELEPRKAEPRLIVEVISGSKRVLMEVPRTTEPAAELDRRIAASE